MHRSGAYFLKTAERMCNAIFLVRNRTTSSHYGLYGLGYTCATVVTTKRSECASRSKSINVICGSDCFLKLENMKVELRVIVDQNATVKK